MQECLYLGNLESKRDWGHAKDYVIAQWLILQHSKPDDFVVSTGEEYTVRDFVEIVCKQLGINLVWEGNGLNEKGFDKITGKQIIGIDKRYIRPTEVNRLIGNSSKARKELSWKPQINFQELVSEMVDSSVVEAQNEVNKI